MWKTPLQVPSAARLRTTHLWGASPLSVEPKGPNGEQHFHYGVDFACGTPGETYGTPVVLPFPQATLVNYNDPLPGTDGQRIATYRYTDPNDDDWDMVVVHLSEIVYRPQYRYGDVVGYVGNSGLVVPAPQIGDPFAGAHLHLGLKRNGRWVDPLLYFRSNDPFIGPDSGVERDIPAWRWALLKAQALLAKLIASRVI